MEPTTPLRTKTPESPEIPHPSMFYHRPDSPPSGGDYGASNDEADSQKGKRQRADSLETDDNARKTRNPRKTAVACNFCRGMYVGIPINRLFEITKMYFSSLAHKQVESYVAMERSPRVITARSASLIVNMFQSNAGADLAKRREAEEAAQRKLAPHARIPQVRRSLLKEIVRQVRSPNMN